MSALNSYTLSVTWAPLGGFTVDHWELYEDGSATPYLVTNTFWQNDEDADIYNPASTHSFQLVYVLTDGRHSPVSTVASGKTWGTDLLRRRPVSHNSPDGLPDRLASAVYWGTNSGSTGWDRMRCWHPMSPFRKYSIGVHNPLDPSTWLVQTITSGQQGLTLNWNTHPGYIYQVITSSNLSDWTNLGGQRYAAGVSDSLFLGHPAATGSQYQIMRLVQ